MAGRDPHSESRRLHRARRAQENQLRDQVLAIADTALSAANGHLARAQLAVECGKVDAGKMITEAVNALKQARALLRAFYDQVA